MGKIPGFRRKAVALGLAIALPTLVGADGMSLGSIVGSVVVEEGGGTLVGGRLHVADTTSGTIFSSASVGNDGKFRVEDLPPGTYSAAIEFEGGLYVVEAPVRIVAGQQRELHLVIPRIVDARSAMPVAESGAAGIWSNPLTTALVVVGAALGVGLIVAAGSDDEQGSAFDLGDAN